MKEALLFLAKNEKLEHLYEDVSNSSLEDLIDNIFIFIDALKKVNPYIHKMLDSYHMFNSLFTTYRLQSAIKYVKENLSGLELTEDKIMRIYNNFAGEWVSMEDVARKEVQGFIEFIRILNL